MTPKSTTPRKSETLAAIQADPLTSDADKAWFRRMFPSPVIEASPARSRVGRLQPAMG